MKIIEIRESIEQCNEAGWQSFDFFVEEPLSEADILKLKPIGDFMYLSALKILFFEIDGEYFQVKGVQGNRHFKVAVHREHIAYVGEIKAIASSQGPFKKGEML